jgi:alkaline phosphatase D
VTAERDTFAGREGEPHESSAIPRAGRAQNRPPSDGMQYFGLAKIDGACEVLTVSLHDLTGATLYRIDIQPA